MRDGRRHRLAEMWERFQEWTVPPSAFQEPGFVRERCSCGLWRSECFHDVVLMPVSDELAAVER